MTEEQIQALRAEANEAMAQDKRIRVTPHALLALLDALAAARAGQGRFGYPAPDAAAPDYELEPLVGHAVVYTIPKTNHAQANCDDCRDGVTGSAAWVLQWANQHNANLHPEMTQ